jgi:hypothetical protein
MSEMRGAWRAIGASVVGLSHQRDGRPCQDAVQIHIDSPSLAVVAIADGHGQAKSFRSGTGATLAVDVAVNVLCRFATTVADLPIKSFEARRDLAVHLPRIVAQTWRERVCEHFIREPLTMDEVMVAGECFPCVVDQTISDEARRMLWRAYGTTLVAVLAAGPYALSMQIGDGLLMAARSSGDAFEVLEPDPLNFANSTTSLSDEDAELRLRWRLIPHEGDFPILYWLCTDGYEKAFRSEDHGGVCIEYRDAFREPHGWRLIDENLADGLQKASTGGTGDDATAAFLFFEESTPGDVDQFGNAVMVGERDPAVTPWNSNGLERESLSPIDNLRIDQAACLTSAQALEVARPTEEGRLSLDSAGQSGEETLLKTDVSPAAPPESTDQC